MLLTYLYKATVVRCIDGDSVIFDIDCGFDVHLKAQSVRLYGIDTAETRGGTPELKVLGNIAKDYVTQMIPVGSEVLLKTHLDRKGKFGRILGKPYNANGLDICKLMIDSGNAVEYWGGKKTKVWG